MSDLTLSILTDRTKYPDEMEITLTGGEKVTVKEFRDSLQPRAEFTKEIEKRAAREKELQGAVDGLNQQLMQALAAKEAAGEPVKTVATGGYSEEEIEADPVLGPMAKRLKSAAERLEAHEARLGMHEQTWLKDRITGQIANLAARHNARFKEKPFDQDGFLKSVQERPLWTTQGGAQELDLESSYNNWVRNDEMARITSEAEARGVEKGKQAARVPAVPFGRRRAPARPEGLPASFQEVTEDMIAADPDVIEAMAKDAEG